MSTPQNQQLTIAQTVQKMEPEFKKALPSHIPVERFTRVALSAVNSNPDILKGDVDRISILNACTRAAQDGLVIDGREAALVVFWTKDGKKAQYMPMVAGILKKMRNSGEIANISTGIVYQNEFDQGRFEYVKGDEESLKHHPILFGEKGDMIGVYAIVTLKDGSKVREFMDMPQIEKVRNVSRSKDKNGNPTGPWKDWFEEMATKSVLRKVSKLCPSSSDLDSVFKADDEDENEIYDPITGEIPQHRQGRRTAAQRAQDAAPPAPGPMPGKSEPEPQGNVIEGEIIDETQKPETTDESPI